MLRVCINSTLGTVSSVPFYFCLQLEGGGLMRSALISLSPLPELSGSPPDKAHKEETTAGNM